MLDWTLRLSDQIPLALEIETYAGDLTLELEALQIMDLIDAITAKLMIRVPPDVAATIQNEIVMGTVEGDLTRFLMIEKEHRYQSANYETATKRADIRISGNKGPVEFV